MISQRNQKILIAFFSAITILLLSFLIIDITYKNRIYFRIKAANIDISKLTPAEAENILQEKIKSFQKNNLIFSYQGKSYEITFDDLGAEYNIAKTIEDSKKASNGKSFIENLLKKIKIIATGKNIEIAFSIKQDNLDKLTSSIEKYLGIKKAQNASLTIKSNKIIENAEKKGKTIDKKILLAEISDRLENFSYSPIEINVVSDYPEIETNNIYGAKFQGHQIINSQIFFIFENQKFAFDKNEIIECLKFETALDSKNTLKNDFYLDNQTPITAFDFLKNHFQFQNKDTAYILKSSFDTAKIKEKLMPLVPEINRAPTNARLKIENGKAFAFSISRNGVELMFDESAEKIKEEILAGKTIIELATKTINPQVSTENIDNLGITSLIATGTSDFAGSSASRITNLTVGSEKINGILVEPQKEFSFNETVGEINAATGYVPGQIIKEGKIITEYGGGICQVSTTLFRAALNAGLQITERYNHAFAVHFYEPQGTDSTVYAPHPDLRFINNTPNFILIQTHIVGNELIFEIYGTDDGRKVTIEGPYIYEQQTNGAMKTVLHQKVYRNEVLERKESFYSNYKSPNSFTTPEPVPPVAPPATANE